MSNTHIVPLSINLQVLKGRTVPTINFLVNNQPLEFLGFRGGTSLRANGFRVFHWGYDPQKDSYDKPKYGSGFTSDKAGSEYCIPILRLACQIVDSDIFIQAVEDFKNDPTNNTRILTVPEIKAYHALPGESRSVFSIILATLSDHFKCDSGTTGKEYRKAREASSSRRLQNAITFFEPNLEGVFY